MEIARAMSETYVIPLTQERKRGGKKEENQKPLKRVILKDL